jgi:hypothetical protein
MRIQRTTNYPDTSTSSDYPGEKKNTTDQTETKKTQQRQIMIQTTTNKPGIKQQRTIRMKKTKKTTDDVDTKSNNNARPGYKKQQRTIRMQKKNKKQTIRMHKTIADGPNTKNNRRSGI